MHIDTKSLHIWSADLTLDSLAEKKAYHLLSSDERQRADRFHFAIHRQRFIAARSILRQLLSDYLNIPSAAIEFAYSSYAKPKLADKNSTLTFNVSHSETQAVFVFAKLARVGIDIEKINEIEYLSLAQRFFSEIEKATLDDLPKNQQLRAFYCIWSRKEAIIKANGKGLSVSLSSFSVSADDIIETVALENEKWLLQPVKVSKAFQAAVATNSAMSEICYRKYV